MNAEKENPALPAVQEERDFCMTRCGNSEIVQTKDGIKSLERYKSRPGGEARRRNIPL